MLEEVLRYCKRLEPDDEIVKEIIAQTYTIESGSIAPLSIPDGQHFAIYGSDFNDGIYQYPADNLKDETFYGSIWILRLKPSFIKLVEEMETWQEKNGAASTGIYQSESFGGWSGTKATGKDGQIATVWSTFESRLSAWRKI